MIVVLGGSGYVGSAFLETLERKALPYTHLSRATLDYTRFGTLAEFLRQHKPEFLINAAGFTGSPNVDACEMARAETLEGNYALPLTIAHACEITGTPWGHISSGCSYNGAKVLRDGEWQLITDLTTPEFQEVRKKYPERIRGFTETDVPNFTFASPPCSFYSGTKALAEEALRRAPNCYIWRLRIPFDERDHPRNYLTKLQRYAKVYENTNSLSHRGDFVRACLELWERRAPFGIYNVTNPGHVSTREVVEMIRGILRVERKFEFWSGDTEFYAFGAKTPRSNCILDVHKLLETGVRMRPVHEALVESLKNWQHRPQ